MAAPTEPFVPVPGSLLLKALNLMNRNLTRDQCDEVCKALESLPLVNPQPQPNTPPAPQQPRREWESD